MSTKTIKQRIALVAVTALTAGVLSVVASPVAYSATTAGENNNAGAANASSQAGTMTLATVASTTGAAISTGVAADARSAGLVNVSDIAGGTTGGGGIAGTTATAVVVAGGALTFYSTTVVTGSANAANQAYVFTVTGGTLSSPYTGSTSGAAAMNSTSTAAYFNGGTLGAAAVVSVVATPSSSATQMIVRMYSGSGFGSGATWGAYGAAATAATALAAPTIGTLAGQITVSVVAASAAGAVSLAKSGVFYDADLTAGATTEDQATGTWSTKSPTAQFATIRVRDAFGTAIAATTGLLQASATNGAIVNITDNTGAAGTASTAFYTGASPDDVQLTVAAPTFAPLSTVVTVSYNGVVIGTKSFTFTGPVSTINVAAPSRINKMQTTTGTSGANGKGAVITFADSAGNPIYVGDAYYATTGFLSAAAADRTAILSIAPSSSSTTGWVDWGCNGVSATTDNLIVTYTNTNGTVATSNTQKVSCAGDPYTYTASYDKASYSPGEVAVLTVSFKDSKGNAANDITSWSSTVPVVTPGGGAVATAPTTSDASVRGSKTYNVVTIVTEGTYQTIVNIPVVKASNTSQSDVIAGFTLKAQGTTVTNAEVLKSIVSLIASINKQIQALQKLILRR
jgi:hypothetical protein